MRERKGRVIKEHVQGTKQWNIKNSIGVAKEFICTTHGHGLREGLLEGREYWAEEVKGEKTGTTVIT